MQQKIKLSGLLVLLPLGWMFFNGCNGKSEKVYQVGVLCGLEYIAQIPDGFKAKMAELGYIEGENIVYHIKKTNFEPVKEANILMQFVEDNNLMFLRKMLEPWPQRRYNSVNRLREAIGVDQ